MNEHVFDQLLGGLDQIDRALAALDANGPVRSQPATLLERLLKTERRIAAARTVLAGRAAETNAWVGKARSPEQWLAEKTGTTFGDARRTLETARELEALPTVADAFANGKVSEAQVRTIAAAGVAAAGHEGELVHRAGRGTLRQLKDRSRKLSAQQRSREEETKRLEQIQRRRNGRWYTNHRGADVLEVAFGPEQGLLTRAHVEAETDAIFRVARAEGRREPRSAYVADAVATLLAGRTLEGGTCEVPGVGPVPVELVERFLDDAFVKCVIRDGVEIRTVVHYGRTISAELRTALDLRDPTCARPDCDQHRGLEYTHNDIDHVDGGPVSYANIRRKCGRDHDDETYRGHALSEDDTGIAWRDRTGAVLAQSPAETPEAPRQLQLE